MGHLGLTFLKEKTSVSARFAVSLQTMPCVCKLHYTLSLHIYYRQNLLQLLTLKLQFFMSS